MAMSCTDSKKLASMMPARYGVTSFLQGPGMALMVRRRWRSHHWLTGILRRLRRTLRSAAENSSWMTIWPKQLSS